MILDTLNQKIQLTEELIAFIIEERKKHKISAASLASQLKKSQSWIAQIENGRKQKISTKELVNIFCILLGDQITRESTISYLEDSFFSHKILYNEKVSPEWFSETFKNKNPKLEAMSEVELDTEFKDALQLLVHQFECKYNSANKTEKKYIINGITEQFFSALEDIEITSLCMSIPFHRIDDTIIRKKTMLILKELYLNYNKLFDEWTDPNLRETIMPIDISLLTTDDYNELLLSKPLVGGIYKIKTKHVVLIPELQKEKHIYCVVIGNSLEYPDVKRSVIVPINNEIISPNLPTHYNFNLFDTVYMAWGESYTSFDNEYLTDLKSLVSLNDYINIQNTVSIQNGMIFSKEDLELIKEQRIDYFQHMEKYHNLFF